MRSGTQFNSLIKRADRYDIDLPAAAFRADGTMLAVVLQNISYNGCLVTADCSFVVGETIRIAIPRMGEMKAQVRWASSDGEVGTRFVLEEINPHEPHVPPERC